MLWPSIRDRLSRIRDYVTLVFVSVLIVLVMFYLWALVTLACGDSAALPYISLLTWIICLGSPPFLLFELFVN